MAKGKTKSKKDEESSTNQKFDKLLGLPTMDELEKDNNVEKMERKRAKFEDFKDFTIAKRTFDCQYSEIYSHRLRDLKPMVIAAAQKKWKKVPVLEKLLQVKEDHRCALVGTLFKQMPLIPRVLDEFTKEKPALAQPPRNNFVSEEDSLILEDETGRTFLVGLGKGQVDILVTGIVVAVLGTSLRGGEFQVEELLFPGLAPQDPIPKSKEGRGYVALFSGTRVGDSTQNPLALQLAVDYISGYLGSDAGEPSKIVRVVFAGNSLCSPEQSSDYEALKSGKVNSKQQRGLVAPLKELDFVLTDLTKTVDVDVMPGPNDPANFTFPQQALNGCLLPSCTRFTSFQLATNPYHFQIDGVQLLGTSGQNVNNIDKYMVIEDKSIIAEKTLQWRHLAPTAPDQLPCYPFSDRDPFVLEKSPHVYFIGNQSKFESKEVKGDDGQKVLMIMVPSFADSSTMVLVNLDTLEAKPIKFNTTFQ